MNQLTPEQKRLNAGWQAFHQGAGAALEWIEAVRDSAPSLDSEADQLSLEFYRARNLAKSLSRAAITPMTVGFFGLSQAGKSYLISALAAGANGKLETHYGPARLDFIKHVNPVGGGKEATGLVTRFSRTANAGPAEFPVELKLFREIEIAKVLANAWFNDFDHEREDVYEIDESKVTTALATYEGELKETAQPGMTPEEVVELWDYLHASFPKSVSKLNARYWPRVIQLAPRLGSHQRAELFALLWGEQPELTNLYRQLAQVLGSLGHASRVFAPLRCLVVRDGDGFSQRDSIMNVDILERLGTAQDLPMDVCPVVGEKLGSPVNLPVACLAALTAELTFPLVEPTRDSRVEKVDLLDFPGYRGRLNLRQVGEPGSQEGLSQLLLRGKVAYLFERYTDSQEMNGLVVCTSSSKQSDVTSVGPVLSRWIEKTQGDTANERGSRDPGLIWALTMFDMRINGSLQQPNSQLREGWEGLIKMTMLERFGSYDWMQEWAPGKAFDNTFLVRKPRLPVPFIINESGREVAIHSDATEVLGRMEDTFIESPSVLKHVNQPADAWGAMLTLDDGGMSRIGDYLGRIAGLDYKLGRIANQLETTHRTLIKERLTKWHYGDSDGEVAEKRDIAKRFWQELQTRLASLGELQHHFELDDELVRDLYLSDSEDSLALEQKSEQEEAATNDAGLYGSSTFGLEGGFGDLPFGSESTETATAPTPSPEAPVLQSADHRFARAVYNAWVGHIRELPQRQGLLKMLGLERDLVQLLANELITGASRFKVQEQLHKALISRVQSGARRDRLVARQVLTAQMVLGDFIAWLGFHYLPTEQRPSSFVGAKAPLFCYEQQIPSGEPPQLPEHPVNQAAIYLGDWLSGLCLMTQENAGHGGGREITIEQNERLGEVLEMFTVRETTHA